MTLLGFRYPEGERRYSSKHVVHGHTPRISGQELLPRRTNLDTFAWRTGRLVVAVFDDEMAGGPFDLIEVKGPAA